MKPMNKTLSLLTATLAALAIAATPALAGEDDDDDDSASGGGGGTPVTQVAPRGGVATGLGGTADDGSGSLLLIGGLALDRRRWPPRPQAARVVRAVIAVAAVLAATGCGSPSYGDDQPTPTPPAATATVTTATLNAAQAARRRVSAPVRVVIGAIAVSAPLIPLGLDSHGALEVPKRFDQAGWWTGGSRPGERGPAVIAGHVDSKTGPAIFYRLGKLRRGDQIVVQRRDGSKVSFRVTRVEHVSKNRFPTTAGVRADGPARAAARHLLRDV